MSAKNTSKNTSNKTSKKPKLRYSSQTVKRKGRPAPLPIILNRSKSNNNANHVKNSLKRMSRKKIDKIFQDLDKQKIKFTFDCKKLPSAHGREMVEILSINGKPQSNLFFYKSSGTSRGDNAIKNIWFPCGDTCLSPRTKRITKAENRFISNNSVLRSQVSLENNAYVANNNGPHLKKYGRFINKNNALISKMLGEEFKCV